MTGRRAISPAPELQAGRPRGEFSLRSVAGLSAAILAGAALELARQPGVSALDSLWGEDGGIFLQQALVRPFTELALMPYAGYVHLVPRLIALVASLVPLSAASVVMSGAAALVMGMLAVFIYEASSSVIRSRAMRAALAAAFLLVPTAQVESTNVAANLHYFLFFAAFWALVWMPARRAGIVLASLVLAAAALSDLQIVLLVPVAIARAVKVPNWKRDVPLLVWAGATALQVLIATAIQSGPTPSFPGGLNPTLTLPDVGFLYPLRVAAVALVGAQWADRSWLVLGSTLIVLATVALIAGVLYVARRPALPTRGLILLCVAESILLFAVGTYLRGDARMLPTAATSNILTGAPRYTVVPILFLYASAALVLDRPDPRWKAPTWEAAGLILAALFAFTSGMNFSMPNGRSGGPSWSREVTSARGRCTISPETTVTIPITPREWSVTIPCSVVLTRSSLSN